jgi:hypothetical protein
MRALGVTELLAAWEQAYAQRPAVRALTLLAAASSAGDPDPRSLPLGERDVRLLALREAAFGGDLASVASCSACGEPMDLAFTTRDVRAPDAAPASAPLSVDGYEVEWRLPTGGDLAALRPELGPAAAQARLLEACVVRAARGGVEVAAGDLPAGVREAVAAAVEEADPQADVELTLACPECAHPNRVPFDVAAYFWDELNAWAYRTLRDVHTLASTYGWSEREILAMTPFRRSLYMEMLGP